MACAIVMIRCSRQCPRHVVVNLLSVKIWSWHQASWIAIIIITFNSTTQMLYHDEIGMNMYNYLSSAIIECCDYPLLQFINSIICTFISVYRFKIIILLVFQLCFNSGEMIDTNHRPIFDQKNKILLIIIFRVRKINYNMLYLNKSYNEMINNMGNNYKSTSIVYNLRSSIIITMYKLIT